MGLVWFVYISILGYLFALISVFISLIFTQDYEIWDLLMRANTKRLMEILLKVGLIDKEFIFKQKLDKNISEKAHRAKIV